MTTTGIKVTPEQLQSLSRQVNAGATQIAGELAGLQKAIASIGTGWTGAAHGRFDTLWGEWQTGAKSVQDALTGIGGLLAQAGTAYADAEAHIAASFNAM